MLKILLLQGILIHQSISINSILSRKLSLFIRFYYKKVLMVYYKYQPMKESNKLDSSDKILIGYYDLRGKVQVCRLLCEYTELAYRNVFFTPPSW